MSESFEARLTAASSKEVFKKAKQLLRHGGLLCCMEASPGVLRAVCRDSDGMIHRSEFHGFPKGPFSGTCSCGATDTKFCCHAMASALYHAKYTIKYKEQEIEADPPARYAGLRFAGLDELLTKMLEPNTAHVEINAKSEFPHLPSKWERVPLCVTLKTDKREYMGNLNNLRHLYFEKSLAVTLQLSAFSLQDQQIIRFLALHAAQDDGDLTLDSEQCADFFHCLAGFPRFSRLGEAVVVHKNTADPLLLVEKLKDGSYVLKSAIAVDNSPLPLENVKIITGRNGCWVGLLGEYWWVPAHADVNWLRAFLRTSVQACDAKTAQTLLESKDQFPVKIIPSTGCKVKQKKFQTLYDGTLDESGTLTLKIYFDYNGNLCKPDQMRLAAAQDGTFWRRNTKEEFEILRELENFGFRKTEAARNHGVVKLCLKEREAIGMFVDELIPKWIREKRPCLLSSSLAALTGSFSAMELKCSLLESTDSHFIIEFTLSAAGLPIRWKKLVQNVAHNEHFLSPGEDGSLVKIPEGIRAIANAFSDNAELMPKDDSKPNSDILQIPRTTAVLWATLGSSVPGAVPVEFLRMKVDMEQLRDQLTSGIEEEPPDLFHGTLRPYQAAGIRWISGMFQRNCNLILADEMGLGKTIQTLAALVRNPQMTLPAMVICPTSLTANWRREAERFTPSLRTCVISGAKRKEQWEASRDCDLIICSYAIIKRDTQYLHDRYFRCLVLDEAQHIKNPASANAQSCKMIHADHKLVLTGTPLENSTGDLWSIFDFLHTGFFGPLPQFRNKYNGETPEQYKELAERIAPYMLRRKKAEVCLELPEKQEQTLYCEMTEAQRAIYAGLEAEAMAQCADMRSGKTKLSGVVLLASIMRLRQVCCDPALLPAELLADGIAPESAKMELLQEILMQSLDSGHKILVFSQFTSLLKLIRTWLENKKIPFEYLDGTTKDRQKHVDNFNQSPDIPVFLLSLKAGGVGLNLTAADTVILCDPWWNPAAENQATDRTHRIGQTKNVNCIRLAVKDSIEERVLALQQKKRNIFQSVVEDAGTAASALTLDDFEFLLGTDKKS